MTPDAAVDLIANRLGKRGTALDSEIIDELQAAQIELEEMPTLPWFLLTSVTSTMTANTATTALPSAFLLEDDYSGLFAVDTTDNSETKEITKKDYNWLQHNKASFFGTAKFPEHYAIQGSNIVWFPTPDAAYSYTLWYYQKDPTTISAGGSANLWLTDAPSVLYNLAGYNMAKYLRFAEVAGTFLADYNTALSKMLAKDEARRQAAMEARMGG